MKIPVIIKSSARIWRAKLNSPFRTSLGSHAILENVLFSVEFSSGIKGFGEAAIASHITGESVSGTLHNLIDVTSDMIGCSFSGFPKAADGFLERFRENGSALAAVEMALLDAATRERGMPLWRAFGSRCHKLKTDMTVVLGTLREANAAARMILQKGIRAFKVKIGGDFDHDIKRVIAVSKVTGSCPICLDANQAFTAAIALKFLKELSRQKVRPALIEQPVPKKDWEGLKKVTRESRVLVLADESVSSLADAKRLVKENAAGAINIKLMKTGLLGSYEIAKYAKKHGIRLMIGCMMETPLATTAAAHLAAGIGGFDFIDLDTPFFMAETVTRGGCMDCSGVYDLSKVKAGIGVEPIIQPTRLDKSNLVGWSR